MSHLKFIKTCIPLCILLLATFFSSGCIQQRPYSRDFYLGRQNFLNENYALARRQLMGPAKAGNAEAQYAIGYMHLNGLGTPQDRKMGLKWIRMSANSGYYPAQEALEILTTPHHFTHGRHYTLQLNTHSSENFAEKNVHSKQELIDQPVSEATITYVSTTHPAIPESLSESPRIEKNEILKDIKPAYTIQLMGSHDLKNIQSFVKKNGLKKETYSYPTQKDGKPWHILLYGTYSSSSQAKQAIESMPNSLKSLKPWVKLKRSTRC